MDIDDNEIDFSIDRRYGIGLKFTLEDGSECISIYKDGFPRKAKLDITSWRGISIGATHYYGKIYFYSLSHKLITVGPEEKRFHKPGDIMSTTGRGDDRKPKQMSSLRIHITRKLTKKEISERPDRWEAYSVGDHTDCFNSEGEVTRAAKRVFGKVFGKGWVLVVSEDVYDKSEDCWEERDKVLLIGT